MSKASRDLVCNDRITFNIVDVKCRQFDIEFPAFVVIWNLRRNQTAYHPLCAICKYIFCVVKFWIQKRQQSYHFRMRNVHENTRETKRKCEYKEIESDCHVCRLCAISFYFVGCGAVSATEWWCWYFCYFFIVLHCQSDGLHFILCCEPIVYGARSHSKGCGWLLLVYRFLYYLYFLLSILVEHLVFAAIHKHPSHFATSNDIENVFKRMFFWCGVRAWVHDDKIEPPHHINKVLTNDKTHNNTKLNSKLSGVFIWA